MYDYLIFIGRFQPIHAGHEEIILKSLGRAKKLILLVGSADAAPAPRNPFTFAQRKAMIEEVIDNDRVIIKPLYDYEYNDDAWMAHVQAVVSKTVREDSGKSVFESEIGLAGCAKDNPTSFYLKMFPQWSNVGFPQVLQHNSTAIRNALLVGRHHEDLLPEIEGHIEDYTARETFKNVMAWHEYDLNYKNIWDPKLVKQNFVTWARERGITDFSDMPDLMPFPVQFHCSDAVCIQSGHILLVTRKNQPGKGLLALPGGHLENAETLLDCSVRELLEETAISDFIGQKQGRPMPPGKLSGFIKKDRCFDHPHRSSRGRVITQAFLYQLPATKELWKVKGMDDAEHAAWYELGTLTSDMMFEDHAHIIRELAGYDLAPSIG